jgi:hypothetical protein
MPEPVVSTTRVHAALNPNLIGANAEAVASVASVAVVSVVELEAEGDAEDADEQPEGMRMKDRGVPESGRTSVGRRPARRVRSTRFTSVRLVTYMTPQLEACHEAVCSQAGHEAAQLVANERDDVDGCYS